MEREVVMRVEWNGKNLTKKRALFLCWKLWEWLGKNPDKDKDDWPEWDYNGGKVHNMNDAADCPCCEYNDNTMQSAGCEECPLRGFWKRDNYCLNSGSQYCQWVFAKTNKPNYAKRIAAAAKRRYEKL